MEMFFDKVLPHSIEAEQSILGSIILDRDCITTVLDAKISENDFFAAQNKEIYIAMIDLFNLDKPIDLITITNQLTKRGSFDAVGGLEYLTYIATLVPTTANLSSYIKIVLEKSQQRELINASNKIIKICMGDGEDNSNFMEDASSILFSVLEKRSNKGYEHIKNILNENFARLNEIAKNGNKVTGIPTGFSDLDHILAGLQSSNLILVAARPGMGKTSFALNIVQYAAVRHNVPTVVFSLEMSKEELANRILSGEAMVSSHKLRTGDLDDEDFSKLAMSIAPLSKAPIFIDDTSGISVTEIRAKCKRLKLEQNIGLVVIDYLQLMQGRGKSENRQQEISEISRSLKLIAKELQVPVICLSQLSRAPEARSDHRPLLSDLRESGAIEQDADIVMFLYRDDYYNEDSTERNIAECIISKHRNGSTGKVNLVWLSEYTKFGNYKAE